LTLYYPFFFFLTLKVAVYQPEYPSERFPKDDPDCPDRIGSLRLCIVKKQSPCQFAVAVTVADLSIFIDKNVIGGVRCWRMTQFDVRYFSRL
jgi:hypothetical protein